MNTISNTQSTTYMYALKRIQEAKALEQSKAQHQKKQEENDSILISQQALQTTQVASSSSPLNSLVSAEQSLRIRQMPFKVYFNLEARKFKLQEHTVIKLGVKAI